MARPRAQFTLWVACHNRLPTKDRLLKFGTVTDGKYAFCDLMETADHILFSCPKSADIWNFVLSWMKVNHQPGRWKNGLTWLEKHTRGKSMRSKLLKCVVAETIYDIWSFRNLCIFLGHNANSNIGLDVIRTICHRASLHSGLNLYCEQLKL
ncbi:PREDICTED: uncharacterized protein LOC109326744 [Lupinus angustifolius]|uniref:uncharacterized protein LOC109326744 n=1 Tax=Lupinus angustifolius TaxID=3871 RepID=UPI00092E8EA9|nr:PREDICTED: uncharacterized protein LOC109326744 [Lupinus angustifolius]